MLNESVAPEDTVERFAADLRRLRLSADQPTLERLARETELSRTVLSESLNGKQLPSPRTVDRLITALGGDRDAWLARRDELARRKDPEVAEAVEEPVEAEPAAHATMSRRAGWLLAALALIAGLLVGGGVGFGLGAANMAATPLAERTQIAVKDGLDPAKTACVNDAKVAVASKRVHDTLLEIVWSNKCNAGWGRVTRYDEGEAGNTIEVSLYPQSNPDSADRQTAKYANVRGVYTTLLVRPGDDMLCATGDITVDGEPVSLGEPLCT